MLGLEKVSSWNTYPLYQNDDGICLIVSGMGKTSAAAATAYLAATQENKSNAVRSWLNVGIAGHQSADLGEGLLARKISESGSGRSYYPSMLFSGFSTSEIITVDQPELEYPENAAYEMEAIGFYETSMRLVTSELVQVFKIVSDNPANHVDNIDLDSIGQWINGQRKKIVELVGQLQEAANNFNGIYSLPEEYFELENKANFSVTQRLQLKRMCQRYLALGREQKLLHIINSSNKVARQIIRELETGLSASDQEA